jgi:hypothetical protein
MAMHDPVLHQFISYLAERKAEQENNPELHVRIELSRDFIKSVRESFKQNILEGERQLHVLSHLLSAIFLDGEFELHSNVIGALPDSDDRPFHIRERINRENLFSITDIDLGNQMLDNFRYRKEDQWVPLDLSANFVEYLPQRQTTTGVNRLTSRVKAEEELWNKVTDEIFHVDQLVSKDKHLRQYSKYVKDIFGIKIVCEDEAACFDVHTKVVQLAASKPSIDQLDAHDPLSISEQLLSGRFTPEDDLSEHSHRLLKFLETKDYLSCPPETLKKTGWKALKSVVEWHGRLFEIQFQPLSNYYLELDHMAGPSHKSFKIVRDSMREDLVQQIPLYGFYRDLLKMLFLGTDVSFEYENASIAIL